MPNKLKVPTHPFRWVVSGIAVAFCVGCSLTKQLVSTPINPIIGKPEIFGDPYSPIIGSDNFLSIVLTSGFDNKRSVVYLDEIRIFEDIIKPNQFDMHSIYKGKTSTSSHQILIYFPDRNEHFKIPINLRNGKWFYFSFRDSKVYLQQHKSPIEFM